MFCKRHPRPIFIFGLGILALLLFTLRFCFSDRNATLAILENAKDGSSTQQVDARERLLKSGTNCLPLLLDLFNARDSRFTRAALRIQSHLPMSFRLIRSEAQKRALAVRGLCVLGPIATSAIPELAVTLGNPRTSSSAYEALLEIGPACVPFVSPLLLGSNLWEQRAALSLLVSFPTDSDDIFTNLLLCTTSADPQVRASAAAAIGSAQMHAERSIPALINLLSDANGQVRASSAHAIGRFRAVGRIRNRAAAAESSLLRALSDNDPQVREAAAMALDMIKSERELLRTTNSPVSNAR
jgi:HEAT repeat protein